MPYFIEQTKGPTVDQLSEIHRQYRDKEISQEAAFIAHYRLFVQVKGRDPFRTCHTTDPKDVYWFKLGESGPEHIDYLIDTWFPFYTNMITTEGEWEWPTRRLCNTLNLQNPTHKYEVCYEY